MQHLLMASLLLTMVLPMLSVMTLPPEPLILAASSGSEAQWSFVKLRASLSLEDKNHDFTQEVIIAPELQWRHGYLHSIALESPQWPKCSV